MKKSVITLGLCIGSILSSFVVQAGNDYPEKSLTRCKAFTGSENCNQCFDGGSIYQGYSRNGLYDEFVNTTTGKFVYFENENPYPYSTQSLQSSMVWTIGDPLFEYVNNSHYNSFWFTAKDGRPYHIFDENFKDKYLQGSSSKGIYLKSVGNGADASKPGFLIKVSTNYHPFTNGTIGNKKEHVECFYYKAAWCGDGITDTQHGETCDDGSNNGKEGYCNTSCTGPTPYCGDNIVNNNEKCDDGKNNGKPGYCDTNCDGPAPYCGDGIVNNNEICDPKDEKKTNRGDYGCNNQCEQALPSVKCDQVSTGTLRVGKQYTFGDQFNAGSSDRWLKNFKVQMFEQYDYNLGDNPEFYWVNTIKNNGLFVPKRSTGVRIIQAEFPYQVRIHPNNRSFDNLYIEYNVGYANSSKAGADVIWHKECAHYEISRCGDGIIDTKYDEVCDPGDTANKTNWGDGCDENCQPTYKAPACNSKYTGQPVEDLVKSDDLCSEGTVDKFEFNPSSNKWTWTCLNKAGSGVNCSATKLVNTGKIDVTKTLVSPEVVTATGQEVTWKIVTKAVSGNVTNFTIKDQLPSELSYKSFKVTHISSGLTVSSPSFSGNEVIWDVKGTLKEGDYIEMNLVTTVKIMPTQQVKNVVCVYSDDEHPMNPDDCDEDITHTPICSSQYNGKLVVSLSTGDKLCESGTVSDFAFNSSANKWTWKCLNKAGSGVECSATKTYTPPSNPGNLHVEKTLTGKVEVTTGGDPVTWNIKVWATSGNVTDFVISDSLPSNYLGYFGSEVTYTPSGLTVSSGQVSASGDFISWKVNGTIGNSSSDYIIIEVRTFVKKMPKKQNDITNVACVTPDINNPDCDENTDPNCTCDPEPIGPDLRLKKTFTDGSKKLINLNIGDEIAYRIEFGNSGNTAATITSIKDFLPKSVEYVTGSITINGATHSFSSGAYSEIVKESTKIDGVYVDIFTGFTLNPDQSGYIILTGKVISTDTGARTNWACIYLNDEKVDCDDAVHEYDELLCKNFSIESGELTYNGGSKNVSCSATSGDSYNEITIDCGEGLDANKRFISKTGNIQTLTGICEYPANNGNKKNTYHASCKVNNTTAPACSGDVVVDYYSSGGGTSCTELQVTTTQFNGNGGDTVVSCKASQSTYIEIYCGNKSPLITGNGVSLTGTCTYSSVSSTTKYKPECRVTSSKTTSDACKKEVTLKVESNCCSGGGGGGSGGGGGKCTCVSKGTPACFNVNNGNVSIQQGEVLPFIWTIWDSLFSGSYMKQVEKVGGGELKEYTLSDSQSYFVNDTTASENGKCSSYETGSIAMSSMRCTFEIWNRSGRVYTIEGPCLDNKNANMPLLKSWREWMEYTHKMETTYSWNNGNNGEVVLAPSIFYIEHFGEQQNKKTITNNGYTITQDSYNPDILGEYKLRLVNVEYLECDCGQWKKKEADWFVCENNFVVTNNYTVQKTPAGTITATTQALNKYHEMSGSTVFTKYLSAIDTEATTYTPNDTVKTAMDNFINKYQKLAVKVNSNSNALKGTDIRKVPGKNIYFIDGDVVINGSDKSVKAPFTIVQTNPSGNVTINGSVNHNMMLLTRGTITFKGNNRSTQTVKGIYYAEGGLKRTGVQRNDNINYTTRGTEGGLHIKGVVIGGGLDNLMEGSRSNLNSWFRVDLPKTERQRMIMDGASVLIEYSPSIFSKSTMAPGAEDFTTALSIYKN